MAPHFKTICIIIIVYSTTLSSCKKETQAANEMDTWSIVTENFNATGGPSVNKCYIDLYNGKSYTANDTTGISREKIDLVYNYAVSPGILARTFSSFFYSSSASTETLTLIVNAEHDFLVSNADFDALQSASDIDNLIKSKVRFNGINISALLSYVTDNSLGNIFAFSTKKGKLGFFKVGLYAANLTGTDKAQLTLTVKIQK
jgi:hypothetical protein